MFCQAGGEIGTLPLQWPPLQGGCLKVTVGISWSPGPRCRRLQRDGAGPGGRAQCTEAPCHAVTICPGCRRVQGSSRSSSGCIPGDLQPLAPERCLQLRPGQRQCCGSAGPPGREEGTGQRGGTRLSPCQLCPLPSHGNIPHGTHCVPNTGDSHWGGAPAHHPNDSTAGPSDPNPAAICFHRTDSRSWKILEI